MLARRADVMHDSKVLSHRIIFFKYVCARKIRSFFGMVRSVQDYVLVHRLVRIQKLRKGRSFELLLFSAKK